MNFQVQPGRRPGDFQPTSNKFNTQQNHPIISNANEYFLEKKYVSIHSEDRNIFRHPSSAEFEIELPQDYLNVQSVQLVSWSFPANYNVFSEFFANLSMTFKITTPYNPGEHAYSDPLTEAIFAGLYYNETNEYTIIIQVGFYNPLQMATELTNKFNHVITLYLRKFFEDTPQYNYATALFTNYNRFRIVYDDVGQKLWFGNNADGFILTNDSQIYIQNLQNGACARRRLLPNFSYWGLPAFLGFTKCPEKAKAAPFNQVPRFFFGNIIGNDDGFWLTPTLPGADVYFIEAPLKINFMGPAYIYMEIDGLNCIDETSPWNVSDFTMKTNENYGVVNSSFAKIPVPSTPISQWFDQAMPPYKYFYPPAERIRKLKIKLRYHDGELVQFGNFDYSFLLEFVLLRPMSERGYSIRDSGTLSKISNL